MATQFTRRLIIVVPAALQAAANAAANNVEWDGGGQGDRTFTVGLSASGAVPATHYICNTALTTALLTGVGNRLRGAGATPAEAAPIARGATPQANRPCVFDAADWDPDAVLTACNLKRIDAR